VGRLLKKEKEEIEAGAHIGERWTVINFPALAEDDDYLGRNEGDPLWPEFGFTRERMLQIFSDVGPYVASALYQQRPSAADGTIFKRDYFRYFEVERFGDHTYLLLNGKKYDIRDLWAFQAVDTANSIKTINDYFVVSTFLVTKDNDLLLYDVFRTHIEGPDQKPLMKEQAKRYKLEFQAIENKTFGTNLIQECLRDGMVIFPVEVDTDKVTRSLPIAARYASGKVWHRANAPWLADLEDELLSFPRGKNDDQVDTLSMAGELSQMGLNYGIRDNNALSHLKRVDKQLPHALQDNKQDAVSWVDL
jgi:predicted phage terminase large subunit-like protein